MDSDLDHYAKGEPIQGGCGEPGCLEGCAVCTEPDSPFDHGETPTEYEEQRMSDETKATHTPRPWCVANGREIHDKPTHADADGQRANARLIAAAPELLAVCEAALPLLVWLGDYIGNGGVHKHNQGAGFLDRCAAIGAVKDAIAKARGEA